MDEMRLIKKFFTGRGAIRSDVLLGIGDDAAVTRLDDGDALVIAADMLCAGTHFPDATPAHALGHRCLAVNLSDLAAMGAQPLWATLALSMPKAEAGWLEPFADGFFALAERYNVALIGGDTVRGPLSMTVNVHGKVRVADGVVQRCGALAGDGIYVTGQPGLAAKGLQLLQSAAPMPENDPGVERFLYPEPRVREGLALAPLATAMIDLSDGLAVDVERLLKASDCGARLDITDLQQGLPLDLMLYGGDDYELCFCLPAAKETELLARAADWECPVTRIGTVCKTPDVSWYSHGQPCDTAGRPFEHFAG